jgi:predicted permease
MTQTILAALLPVVFVVSLGLLAAHLGIVEKAAAREFAEFIVRFALPIALFGGVLKISPAQIENGPYIVAMAVGLMIPYAIARVIGRLVLAMTSAKARCRASPAPSRAWRIPGCRSWRRSWDRAVCWRWWSATSSPA